MRVALNHNGVPLAFLILYFVSGIILFWTQSNWDIAFYALTSLTVFVLGYYLGYFSFNQFGLKQHMLLKNRKPYYDFETITWSFILLIYLIFIAKDASNYFGGYVLFLSGGNEVYLSINRYWLLYYAVLSFLYNKKIFLYLGALSGVITLALGIRFILVPFILICLLRTRLSLSSFLIFSCLVGIMLLTVFTRFGAVASFDWYSLMGEFLYSNQTASSLEYFQGLHISEFACELMFYFSQITSCGKLIDTNFFGKFSEVGGILFWVSALLYFGNFIGYFVVLLIGFLVGKSIKHEIFWRNRVNRNFPSLFYYSFFICFFSVGIRMPFPFFVKHLVVFTLLVIFLNLMRRSRII